MAFKPSFPLPAPRFCEDRLREDRLRGNNGMNAVDVIPAQAGIHGCSDQCSSQTRKPNTYASIGLCLATSLFGLCLAALIFLVTPAPAAADRAPEPDPIPIEFDLTLGDAIGTALEHNRDLLNRRLDREVRKFSLDVAEDRYRPRFSVEPFAETDRQDRRAGGGAGASLRVPTGGELALRWEEARSDKLDDTWSQTASFSQPLLKGAWAGIDTAALRQARIGERIDTLAFRRTVADLVIAVIRAYRALIRATRRVEIDEASVRRALEQREATRALIRAGRVAPREAVRSDAAIANRELSLARARNGLDAANYALIDLLELGSTVRIRPLEALRVERGDAVVEPASRPPPALEEVLHRRPEFLQAMLRVETAAIEQAVARNRRLPDLTLHVEHTRDDTGRTDSRIRLGAVIPLNDRSPELERLRADNELRKARRNLAELRESIGIEVRQVVNDVEVGLRVTELARGARELAEENLKIERMKFGQGLSSTFEVTASEDDLVRAEQAEVDAIIDWLDALTRLDRVSGRTLETWGIDPEAVTR